MQSFKSIDCVERDTGRSWTVEDPTDFGLVAPGQPGQTSRQGLVELTDGESRHALIKEKDFLEVVEGICNFIDDGANTLPGLLPGTGVDGIFGWLGKLLDGLFDFFDIFGNGLFDGRIIYRPA